jgi:hypothetical protein
VTPSRIELHWRDSSGPRTLALHIADAPEASATQDAASLAVRIERGGDETVIRAIVANRGAEPIALETAVFFVATGLAQDRPARFFKHGYQSWSASRPAALLTPHVAPCGRRTRPC